jgi:tetratricopeptide (TPR) repeat protein
VAVSAVAGMGGVGKTELAIRYARQHEADYPGGICWLNARESNLAAEIIQFAQLYMNLEVPQKRGESPLNLSEQVEWCWQNWQPADGLVLVVLDDVTDLRCCQGVLPTANRFRVLMTTRLRGLDTNFVELPLDVLSPDAALELLTGLVGERRVVGAHSCAPLLCEWLGYLPLGLELVGRYLAEDPDLSLAEMLERLKAQRLQDEAIDLDEQQMQNTFSTAQRGVRAAFELSWQELEPLTQRVAQYLSLYAPTVFVWEWMESETELLNCSKSDFNAAKKQLYKRHLIQRVEEREGGYKIHPLIREFLQAKLAASGHKDKFRQAFAAAFVEIAKEIPESPTRKDIELVKEAIPHLEEVAQNLTDALRDEDLVVPFVGLGRFYIGQGLYTLAEPWLKQCLELSQRQLGEEHPGVATSMSWLAGLYESQGRYSEAEPLYEQALALYKRLLGEEHPAVALSLNNLAGLYKSQGSYSEAEPLYEQALALYKRLLGEEHPSVATSLNNLAGLY